MQVVFHDASCGPQRAQSLRQQILLRLARGELLEKQREREKRQQGGGEEDPQQAAEEAAGRQHAPEAAGAEKSQPAGRAAAQQQAKQGEAHEAAHHLEGGAQRKAEDDVPVSGARRESAVAIVSHLGDGPARLSRPQAPQETRWQARPPFQVALDEATALIEGGEKRLGRDQLGVGLARQDGLEKADVGILRADEREVLALVQQKDLDAVGDPAQSFQGDFAGQDAPAQASHGQEKMLDPPLPSSARSFEAGLGGEIETESSQQSPVGGEELQRRAESLAPQTG